uniref:Thioredoxin domain-containing protein n=1 Tax=Erythrolobus madagascarensis TaxID=708628 RepID=A0A7S0XIJ4_9RHOD|mmetsp:Transcript_1035/g.2025  ORF Transcript_1035/g.2025 Transcript_1035/m.2025 type:complete len:206 (+) Transcript_1035:213-830(+)
MEAFVGVGLNGCGRGGSAGLDARRSKCKAQAVGAPRRSTVSAVLSVDRAVNWNAWKDSGATVVDQSRWSESESAERERSVEVTAIKSARELNDAIMAAHDHTAVVMFHASHCRSCKAMRPRVQKFANDPKYASARIYAIDVSENEDLGRQLGIDRLPTFQFYVNHGDQPGLLDEFSCGGFQCARRLAARLDRFGTSEFDASEYEF